MSEPDAVPARFTSADRSRTARPPILPYAVFACSLVFFWSISARALVYTLMPTIAAALAFSSSTAGLVVASMLLGYCSGGWSSRWLPGSRKTRMVAGVFVSIPAAAAISQANGLAMAIGSTLLFGFGIGLYLPLGMALIVEVGRDGRSAAYMSIHEFAATIGSFAGSVAVAVLLAWTDWQGAILAWCPIGALAALSVLAVNDPERARPEHRRARESAPVSPRLLGSVFIYAVGSMIVMGLVSMLPLIMVRAWDLGQAEAASVVGYTRLAGVIGVAGVGLLADRWGHSRVLVGLQIVALAGLAAMSLGGYSPLFIGGVLLLAIGASGNITLLPVVVAEAFPLRQRESIMAYSTGLGGLLGMVAAPAAFGAMLDAGLASAPILFAATATLLSTVITWQLGRSAARVGHEG